MQPVVIYTTTGGRGTRVRACSRQPAQLGVVAGMPLAEAQALVEARPTARPNGSGEGSLTSDRPTHFEPADPVADAAGLRRVAQTCDCFSPLFGIEEADSPESVLLDVTGCTHLFGGDRGLATSLMAKFREHGFQTRGSLAPTLGAAWAAAHFLAQAAEPTVVTRELLFETLAPLPLAALRLPEKTVATLQELGLRTVSQIRALPRSTLPSRFGPLLLKRLDQAFGEEVELLVTEAPLDPLVAQWAGEWPLTNRETLLIVARELLNDLLSRLTSRRAGVRQLLCGLREPGGRAHEFCVSCVAPTDVSKHLIELLSLQWERSSLPDEIVFVQLEVTQTESLQVRQRDLFGHEMNTDNQRDVAALLDRLSSRLGNHAVLRSRLRPEAQPELAVVYEPWIATARPVAAVAASNGGASAMSRPTHLWDPPQRIEVSIAGPEGAPLSFVWNRREHRVIRSWGPERIETGWWREAAIARDYFRIETQTGHHFWLFHSFQDAAWFVHGAFD